MQTLVIPLKYQENVMTVKNILRIIFPWMFENKWKRLLYSFLAFYSWLKICKLFIQMPMFGISNQINVLLLCTNITTISFSSPWQRKFCHWNSESFYTLVLFCYLALSIHLCVKTLQFTKISHNLYCCSKHADVFKDNIWSQNNEWQIFEGMGLQSVGFKGFYL